MFLKVSNEKGVAIWNWLLFKSIPPIPAQVMKPHSPILHFSLTMALGVKLGQVLDGLQSSQCLGPSPGEQAGVPQPPGCPRVSEHRAQKVFGIM